MAQAHFGNSLSELEAEYLRLSPSPSPDFVDVANLIAFHIHFRLGSERKRACELADEACRMAERLEYTDGMVMAELTRGFIAFRENDAKERVENICRYAMEHAERMGNAVLQAHALTLMSLWCNRYGGEGDALSYALMAHDLLAAHPWNVIGQIAILNQLGTTYMRLRQFDSAARYLEECHTLCQKIDDTLRLLSVRSRLANCWYECEQYDEAVALAEVGINACEPLLPTHIGLTVTYCDFLMLIARVRMQAGSDTLAQSYGEEVVARLTAIENWHEKDLFVTGYFQVLALLGTVRWRAGATSDALDLLHKACAAANNDVPRTNIAAVHDTLSRIYREMGDFRKALEHFEQFYHFRTLAEATRHHEQIQIVFQMSNAIMVQQATYTLHEENARLQEVVATLHTLHRQVRESAHRDSLTHLYNRRYLEEQMPRLLLESRRTGNPLSVAMLDMDNFKAINDTYRHTMGDKVLQAVTELIRRHVRPTDIGVRYGGDEIVLLMPATSATVARAHIEQIHRAVRNHDWSSVIPALQITLSAGVATSTAADEGFSLIDRADALMLTAKRRGKNQLLTA